jgi:hypothetical protein
MNRRIANVVNVVAIIVALILGLVMCSLDADRQPGDQAVYDQVARTTDCVYLRQVLVFSDDDTTGRAYADAAFDLMKALHYSPVGDGQ